MARPEIPRETLRERQRRETRDRVSRAGLTLFAEHGYDATTLDAIAEASGIARRTVFHYFRSKEDISLAGQEALPEALRAAILRQDPATPPRDAVRAGLLALAADMPSDVAVTVGRIVRSSAQLRAANQAKFLHMEQAAFEALQARAPDAARHPALRPVAMIAVGIMRLAIEAWTAEDGTRPLPVHLASMFALLDGESGAS